VANNEIGIAATFIFFSWVFFIRMKTQRFLKKKCPMKRFKSLNANHRLKAKELAKELQT
jgi:hypothetical protein